MTETIKKQIDEFREKTDLFAKGEISVKDYKGFSGKFGSYSQRGGENGMLRLRMTGGRLTKERLDAIIAICDKYGVERMHCTTCQTIQLHNLPFEKIADIMTDAIDSGFYTLGGGGDFPRNVMVSPLAGAEKGESFNVLPYAEKAGEYLISQIDEVKMPRKLKVCFSGSEENAVHATFRDLGFIARKDGKFDVYCAGGMGMYPKMGVKVVDGIEPEKTLYCIKAMITLFCEYGNYENRSRARTRYLQDSLGEDLAVKYNEKLEAAMTEGGLDIDAENAEITKKGSRADIKSDCLTEQKQEGLYAVKLHPIGGNITPDILKKLRDTIKNIDSAQIRLSPDESMYIINCTGEEAEKVIAETSSFAAQSDIEKSVACIGASICQQGLRNSQELLTSILNEVKKYNFPSDALPCLHISGCMSSCGTHQIGSMGFHGKVKMIDKKPAAGFTISINGCDKQGREKFGDEIGVIASDDIPSFMAELGKAVTAANMSYAEFADKKSDELVQIIKKYV